MSTLVEPQYLLSLVEPDKSDVYLLLTGPGTYHPLLSCNVFERFTYYLDSGTFDCPESMRRFQGSDAPHPPKVKILDDAFLEANRAKTALPGQTISKAGMGAIHSVLQRNSRIRRNIVGPQLAPVDGSSPEWTAHRRALFSVGPDGTLLSNCPGSNDAIHALPKCIGGEADMSIIDPVADGLDRTCQVAGKTSDMIFRPALLYAAGEIDVVSRGVTVQVDTTCDFAATTQMYRTVEDTLSSQEGWQEYCQLHPDTKETDTLHVSEVYHIQPLIDKALKEIFPELEQPAQ